MVDGVESHCGLLDQHAAMHLLEHGPVDLMFVPLVGDHKVGLSAGGHNGRLRGRVRDGFDLHLVPALEHGSHRSLIEGAQAGDAGEHSSRRLAASDSVASDRATSRARLLLIYVSGERVYMCQASGSRDLAPASRGE